MKNILLVVLFLSTSHISISTPKQNELPTGYLMVVAAYGSSAESYAIKFVQTLKEKGIEANYGLSISKNMYFVFTAQFDSKSEAVKSILPERERTNIPRAWVYSYKAQNSNEVAKTDKAPQKDRINVTPTVELTYYSQITEEVREVVEKELEDSGISEKAPTEETEKVIDKPILPEGAKFIYIDAIDSKNGNPIEIDFNVIDLSRQLFIKKSKSQTAFVLRQPNSASKMVQLSSNDIGWERQSFDFKFDEPITDSTSTYVEVNGDTLVIRFDFNPIKKGETVTLYKVFFYKDAAIMMAKSEYELQQVVTFLQNNPTRKIAIHGHTNGNAGGKVISMKSDNNTDFFNINADHNEDLTGSAQKLSYERADMVRKYLESQGIGENRMKVNGWGGKKMIYDKHSQQARYNVRVEIEVVED
jgi:outer membrane protein OmpA-like peptidoglycan-associated protein